MSIYSREDYRNKLERNINAYQGAQDKDTISESVKKECLNNITKAQALIPKLGLLDYDARQTAINELNTMLDKDYKDMGFDPEEIEEETKGAIRR